MCLELEPHVTMLLTNTDTLLEYSASLSSLKLEFSLSEASH